jgi:hypothetical protein
VNDARSHSGSVIQDDKGEVRCVNTVLINERLCGPSEGERKKEK